MAGRRKPRARSPLLVCVVSLGCPKNLVDTEVMCGTLGMSGFALTNNPAAADIMLVNTCGFIEPAREEADDEITVALRWKRRKRGRRVVVTGCLVQRDFPEVRKLYPGVDLLVGLDDVPRIGERLAGLVHGGAESAREEPLAEATYLYDDATPRLLLTPGHYAYVKIAEGCNHFCRFCTIPLIRGRQRSRTQASIVRECRNLLDRGILELNLVAQDSTRYGSDLGDGTGLAGLLRELDCLEGHFWVRLLYTHPKHLTQEIIDLLATSSHIVPYIDIPLQHISDHVLKSMGRGVGAAETRRLMDSLRAASDRIAVRTTFLVGYPGETDADFAELLDYVESYRFDRLGVFAYSPEPGTPAATLTEGLVPQDVADARRGQLLEVQQPISLARNRSLVDTTITVLTDLADEDGQLVGRTYADAPDVDNLVLFTGSDDVLAQGFCEVRITEATPYDLHGVAVC